jgi:hypothetical protein
LSGKEISSLWRRNFRLTAFSRGQNRRDPALQRRQTDRSGLPLQFASTPEDGQRGNAADAVGRGDFPRRFGIWVDAANQLSL